VLTNETKLIDNYLCYKATNIYKVTNDIKTFLHPVIAWYCPQIPYRYGPNGYSNLPGLILELQVRNVVFGAKVIKLDSELDFDLKFLDKIKILRGKEVDDAYEKFNGF
jgi:GLPGLI family protein